MNAARWKHIAVIGVLAFAGGCKREESSRIQGYVEGEFVHVACPFAGKLETLHVRRGTQIKKGDPLFVLESVVEKSARDEAARRLAQARASLEDLRKPRRPTELSALDAQLKEGEAAVAWSGKELTRQEELFRSGSTAASELDRLRSSHEQNRQRVSQIRAQIDTARLGAREDLIAAGEAEVAVIEATLVKAEWALAQKQPAASHEGLVFDTIFREGEWVPAGRPVVVLLPPGNLKVRAFVPETRIGAIHAGDRVQVTVDGVREPLVGKVSFISPRAEYTPPVIYSRETRSKLVFMIEASFEGGAAANLHPGQPVDVSIGP